MAEEPYAKIRSVKQPVIRRKIDSNTKVKEN